MVTAHIQHNRREWVTLRQIDVALNLTKGAAFRAFKEHSQSWREGEDYLVLRTDQAEAPFSDWMARGLLYPGSMRAILLSVPAGERIIEELNARGSH